MNTTQLECFLSVSNFLNFSRAAEQLGLTQPAVSHQINTLEDELGVKLFYRTSKRVRLTQQGYLFSQYAQEILSLTRASRARLKESQESSATRFGIGCRSFLELRLLYSVLPRLRAELGEVSARKPPSTPGKSAPGSLSTGPGTGRRWIWHHLPGVGRGAQAEGGCKGVFPHLLGESGSFPYPGCDLSHQREPAHL